MGDEVDQTMGGHGCWTKGFVLHFVLDVGNPGSVSEQRRMMRIALNTVHCLHQPFLKFDNFNRQFSFADSYESVNPNTWFLPIPHYLFIRYLLSLALL